MTRPDTTVLERLDSADAPGQRLGPALGDAMLERYQRHLFHHRKPDGTSLSFRTQVTYLVPVKGLFRWLAQTNRILYNPASELELPRSEHRLPRLVLGVADAEAVLAVPEVTEPLGARDRHSSLFPPPSCLSGTRVRALARDAPGRDRAVLGLHPSHAGPSRRRCDPKASEPSVDAETGFVYLRVRYYDPATKQFRSRIRLRL